MASPALEPRWGPYAVFSSNPRRPNDSKDSPDAAARRDRRSSRAWCEGGDLNPYASYGAMMTDARRGAFDVLLVWSLDRFGRSMAGNVNDALALYAVGVKLVIVRDPWLDTGGPVRDLLLAIFSWVAEQELRRLVERTRAGVERARALGTRSGKPIGAGAEIHHP